MADLLAASSIYPPCGRWPWRRFRWVFHTGVASSSRGGGGDSDGRWDLGAL